MTTWIRKPAEYDGEKTLEQNRWRDRGSVECPTCGREHNLERGDSDCTHCGQMFNCVGQALKPPEQWEDDEFYDPRYVDA